MAEENGRISVSRSDLRADLAEMKLDLLDRIDERLVLKADKRDVDALVAATHELTEWSVKSQRGEFTDAQEYAIKAWISKAFSSRARESWHGWERRLAVYGLMVAVIGAGSGVAAGLKVFFG